MNKETLKGNWNIMKGKVKQQWGKLTDDDITQINGSYDELTGRIEKAYGFQKDQARKAVDDYLDKH